MTQTEDQRSYQELLAICERLEAESGRHLVIQRDLNSTKDRVDRELMRFKAIQNFISGVLQASTAAEFHTLTLETIIEAFEFEVALVLRITADENTLAAHPAAPLFRYHSSALRVRSSGKTNCSPAPIVTGLPLTRSAIRESSV